MIKTVQYVKEALPFVGEFVEFDGYIGRLAVKINLDPEGFATTGDFMICTKSMNIIVKFPTDPENDICPILITKSSLTVSPPNIDDVCSEDSLKVNHFNFTFKWRDYIDNEENKIYIEEEDETEGDKLMDFFFKKEDRNSGGSGFEFL